MSGAMDGRKAANEWRNMTREQVREAVKNQRDAYEQHGKDGNRGAPEIGNGWTKAKPSGLGVQIDAMIQRLKDDGHSPENIARVMRLRADKLEGGE